MAVSRDILGLNARNFLYIKKYNSSYAKKIADDKLRTKKLLLKHEIATPNLLAFFENRNQIQSFGWDLPENGFVIKPARGYGGGGIITIRKWENGKGETITGDTYTIKRLTSHLLDILDGAYSLQFLPDKAFIEERVIADSFTKKLSKLGLPDIRIIVFNHVPVMAMIRIPTKESSGKANLHLGAVGVGIELRTGIATSAVYHNKQVRQLSELRLKTKGVKIPDWDDLLLLASRTQGISELGFAGIDIVFDKNLGALVLEVNARPGLSIQTANKSSLRTRLERVEGMAKPKPERGVEVAKSLFAEPFSEKVKTKPKILSVIELVTVKGDKEERQIKAKLDTGAYRTSIDSHLAKKLNLEMINKKIPVKSASGKQVRKVAKIVFILAGKKIKTKATVADRSHMEYAMIIGRRDLSGFLINPD